MTCLCYTAINLAAIRHSITCPEYLNPATCAIYSTAYRPRFDHYENKVSALRGALLLYMRGTADLKLFAGSPEVARHLSFLYKVRHLPSGDLVWSNRVSMVKCKERRWTLIPTSRCASLGYLHLVIT
jgi:hypothetical protein